MTFSASLTPSTSLAGWGVLPVLSPIPNAGPDHPAGRCVGMGNGRADCGEDRRLRSASGLKTPVAASVLLHGLGLCSETCCIGVAAVSAAFFNASGIHT